MTDALAILNSYTLGWWVMKTDATRDDAITALERRVAALAAMQKRVLDAVLILGLSSAAWDVEDVAQTLRELADNLDRMPDRPLCSVSAELFRDAAQLTAPNRRSNSEQN